MQKIAVLLVDDEVAVLDAVAEALRTESVEITGCTSAEEALEVMKTRSFDVVVSDEQMPNMKGSDFLAEVQRTTPSTPRIMLSGRADLGALARAVNDAEIFRFLRKPVKAKELLRVIQEAAALGRVAHAQEEVWRAAHQQHATLARLGGQPSLAFNGDVARSRFVGFRPPQNTPPATQLAPEAIHRLSEREREIVAALAGGQRVKEIAKELSISAHTVRNHLKAIYRKLNVSSQLELVRRVAAFQKP